MPRKLYIQYITFLEAAFLGLLKSDRLLARYDSDRGGAQEDDRTGQYRDCANEILGYAESNGLNLKVIFLNDGPGLLLGSMWRDYAHFEELWGEKIKVVTLRMFPERITKKWLLS